MKNHAATHLKHCIHCNAWINTRFADDAPAKHVDAAGTMNDPRSPGDYDNICDQCNYGLGLRGGAG